MQLSEIQERLNKLDTEKLTDVVKNYRQYGYNNETRNYALSLLEKQGISTNDLQLTGNFENKEFNLASESYNAYNRNSKIAFVLYLVIVLIKLVLPFFSISAFLFNEVIVYVFFGSLIGYIACLIMSFLNQSEFYRIVGDRFRSEDIVIYFLLGMPFYFVTYFIFQSKMKERLKLIN